MTEKPITFGFSGHPAALRQLRWSPSPLVAKSRHELWHQGFFAWILL